MLTTEFIVGSVREAAVRAIIDFELMRLTAQERDAFVAVLRNPPAPGARLARAVKDYKKKPGA